MGLGLEGGGQAFITDCLYLQIYPVAFLKACRGASRESWGTTLGGLSPVEERGGGWTIHGPPKKKHLVCTPNFPGKTSNMFKKGTRN